MRASTQGQKQARVEVPGNGRIVREYLAYLRVGKGMRPATCEAYARDLEQFAEQLEANGALLVTASETDVRGFIAPARQPC